MIFAFSKIFWMLGSPASLLTLGLLAGLGLGASSRARLQKTGRTLCWGVALFWLALMVFPVGEWALTPLENRFAYRDVPKVDGIIVLGGDEKVDITEARGVPTALDSLRRYRGVAAMARRYPDANLLFTGGSPLLTERYNVADSAVAQALLADMGVPVGRMSFEKESRNTYENAVYSARLLHPQPEQHWLLVTSAWHLPRAMGCFRKAGWTVHPVPTGYFTTGRYTLALSFKPEEQLRLLTMAVHEYVGLIAYWLMDRTEALWPSDA